METKLVFSHYAWTKLLYMRDKGPTEISCYGIGSAENPLFIEDVRLMEQECTSVFTEMDGEALAVMLDEMAAKKIPPDRCCRVWIHTHPGNSANPSMVDEATFREVYGSCPWAVMAIVARGGDEYARLRFKVDDKDFQFNIEMHVLPANYSQKKSWDDEYTKNVKGKKYLQTYPKSDESWKDWSNRRFTPNGEVRTFQQDDAKDDMDMKDDEDWKQSFEKHQKDTDFEDPKDDVYFGGEHEQLVELFCEDCGHVWKVTKDDVWTETKCPNTECRSESIDFLDLDDDSVLEEDAEDVEDIT